MKDSDPKAGTLAVAGILLNPIVLWIAAEGHNDTLVLLFVLAGFVALRRAGFFVGAFAISLCALIKASAAVAAAVLALYAWPMRPRFVQVAAGAACGLLLSILIALPLELGVRSTLLPHGRYLPQFSAQFVAAVAAHVFIADQGSAIEAAAALVLCACIALALYGARLAILGKMEGAAYIGLALWFAIPNPYPWYGLWILPAAFLNPNRPIAWAIVAATFAIFVRYLPDVSGAPSTDLQVAISLTALGPPLAVVLAGALRIPRRAAAK